MRNIFGYSVFIAICIVLGSCTTKQYIPGPQGPRGEDGSPGIGIQGLPGHNGSNGSDGAQGYGTGIEVSTIAPGAFCAAGGVELDAYQDQNNDASLDGTDSLTSVSYVCNGTAGANGSAGSNGTNGTNGTDGVNGTNGTDGANGVSTTFTIVPDSGVNCSGGGFDLTLTDATHTATEIICNGLNGVNGQAGTNGTNGSNGGTVSFSLVQAIEPCGAASSPWKEVILGLQGGQLLSSFSENASGQNTRFSFIPNGTYVDTDSSGCSFTVTGDGSTTSDISWSGGGYSWTLATGWVAHL